MTSGNLRPCCRASSMTSMMSMGVACFCVGSTSTLPRALIVKYPEPQRSILYREIAD